MRLNFKNCNCIPATEFYNGLLLLYEEGKKQICAKLLVSVNVCDKDFNNKSEIYA